ncbi:putative E3 ubiquitin-protein ligase SMURF2 isoform X2 [Penaeus vannamei]|uniref:Putative E3 ubiquitin-protein ligase SMURF2 isoform X2 n=1 Tax=Penaeus vannamei TaxID=6689 RepID=A0A3R7LYR9_PENVA|nr:putative E3 ubiquitin-protein ligase SMURF2 isoform X2 [Penaeus vannamei]
MSGAQSFVFDFTSDMEGWASYRGSWRWADRAHLNHTLPSGSSDDGFALLDEANNSDELYTPYVSAPFGATAVLRFFLRSQWQGSNTMYVSLMEPGQSSKLFLELSHYGSPMSNSWVTVSGEIPPMDNDVLRPLALSCTGVPLIRSRLTSMVKRQQLLQQSHRQQLLQQDTTEPQTTAAPTEPQTTQLLQQSHRAAQQTQTTAAPTEPQTTAAPTEPETTAAPTEPQTTAAPQTDSSTEPQTTAAPTAAPTEPQTTAAPTEPQTTAAPTEPQTTAAPTEPQTTAAPTEATTQLLQQTDNCSNRATDNSCSQTTAAPTEPQTTAAPTEPETTAAPTEPQTTAAPTEHKTTAAQQLLQQSHRQAAQQLPTEPQTTAAPTEPQTTAAPTEPQTTAAPTEPQTTEAPTTEGPPGPLIFDFQSSVQGWTLSEMNGAAWRRVTFDNTDHVVTEPPEGAKVLQVFPTHVFSGTTLAQSPLLEAVSETVRVKITFWMDGTHDFPTQLKVRKRTDFSTFDINPVMNLDPFGDQENHKWIAYSATMRYMTIGQTFTLNLEGSLGSNPNNSVAVNKVELEGVKAVQNDFANLVDFENGLFGWSTGNMDGGRWVLQSWSDLDPSLYVPKPSDGKNFLFVNRFDIHSGVISLESPPFPIQAGQRKKVHIKFWIRGSVVYPAALRLRKKSVNGAYDDLPFLNLAGYGDVDNPDWIFLDKQYYIPVDETEDAFQVCLPLEFEVGKG